MLRCMVKENGDFSRFSSQRGYVFVLCVFFFLSWLCLCKRYFSRNSFLVYDFNVVVSSCNVRIYCYIPPSMIIALFLCYDVECGVEVAGNTSYLRFE